MEKRKKIKNEPEMYGTWWNSSNRRLHEKWQGQGRSVFSVFSLMSGMGPVVLQIWCGVNVFWSFSTLRVVDQRWGIGMDHGPLVIRLQFYPCFLLWSLCICHVKKGDWRQFALRHVVFMYLTGRFASHRSIGILLPLDC